MALAQQLLESGRGVNGSAYLVAGMNSSDDPMFIDDRAYFSSMNTVNRGGIVQTRPGYRCTFTLPEGNLQGACYYRPLGSAPYIMFAVEGKVYASKAPFTSYFQLPGIQFYRSAKFVYWQVATKSVQLDSEGVPVVIDPIRLVVMQDGGYTPPAFWDGEHSRHLNPGNSETPLGGPMAWSGGRLWVARGNQLFASDIDDPLAFTEDTYLGEGGSFFMVEPITGMAEIPGLATPQLAVFTAVNAQVFKSGTRDRSTWKTQTNPPFQSTLFPNVGCAAHRSIVSLHGLLWWMTPTGLTNFDSASQAYVTSVLAPQDIEMAASKGSLSPNVEQICSASFENYALFSLPVGSKQNKHTWVLDKAVLAGLGKPTVSTWNSFWTGTNPREWATGPVDNVQRIFHVSTDADGTNRLWESFISDRQDNRLPITAFVETKTHIDFSPKATGLDLKKFVFAEITMTEIVGDVSVAVYWAGTRGRYKKIAEYNWTASEGSLANGKSITLQDRLVGWRPQERKVRTPSVNIDAVTKSDCSSCGIESPLTDHIDVGFSLLVVWSGRAALRSYRIFADPQQEIGEGVTVKDETGKVNVVKNQLCPGSFDN